MQTNKKYTDDMRPEYDFSNAERAKFYRPLDKGYKVHVHQQDGTEVVNHYSLAEGTVLLAPDVREYFADSQAVNEALRSLIHLAEKVAVRKYRPRRAGVHQVAEKINRIFKVPVTLKILTIKFSNDYQSHFGFRTTAILITGIAGEKIPRLRAKGF